MTAARGPPVTAEFDVVGVSIGAAVVSGALSVVAPSLVALTGSLAVLALAGWVVLVQQTLGSIRRRFTGRTVAALASAGMGAVLFLAGVGGLPAFRGIVLGVSLVPLWLVARQLPLGGW
jgi:hypothetical protein